MQHRLKVAQAYIASDTTQVYTDADVARVVAWIQQGGALTPANRLAVPPACADNVSAFKLWPSPSAPHCESGCDL